MSLRMLPGLPRYPGTTRNGVTTNNFGDYRASYRFMGAPVWGSSIYTADSGVCRLRAMPASCR